MNEEATPSFLTPGMTLEAIQRNLTSGMTLEAIQRKYFAAKARLAEGDDFGESRKAIYEFWREALFAREHLYLLTVENGAELIHKSANNIRKNNL